MAYTDLRNKLCDVLSDLDELIGNETCRTVRWDDVTAGDFVRWVGEDDWQEISDVNVEIFDNQGRFSFFARTPVQVDLGSRCEVRLPRPHTDDGVRDLILTVEYVCDQLSKPRPDVQASTIVKLLRASLADVDGF